MASKKQVVNKKARGTVITPVGRFLYIHLSEPNAGQFDNGKYVVNLLINKEQLKTDEKYLAQYKEFRKAVREVAKEGYKDSKIKLEEIQVPIKDGDEKKSYDEDGKLKPSPFHGNYFIKATTTKQPIIVGPTKEKFSAEEIIAIKDGDYGRMGINIYAYNTAGNSGIGFGLDTVQFKQAGEPLGGASGKSLALIGELDTELEELSTDEDTESDDEDGFLDD